MIHKTISLAKGKGVTLTTHIHAQSAQGNFQISKRPAIIVMPKGAYSFLSHAEEWHINPDAIALMGFSAGACLAAMSATQWNTPGLAQRLGVPFEGVKPNAAVIIYASWDITNTIQKDPKYYNPDCAKIAKDCTPELDFINYTGSHMPPLFIWHNRYDKFVPAINPVMIAAKMLELGILFELHLFQGGEHGMSVCNRLSSYGEEARELNNRNPNVAMWVPMCTNWMNNFFDI